MRFFVDWSLVEQDLLRDPALGAIAEWVHHFVDHRDAYEVEQVPGADGVCRVRIVGGRLVTLHFDALRRTFTVLLVQRPPPSPDTDGEPDNDPGEYEDD